jgi:MFS family permease
VLVPRPEDPECVEARVSGTKIVLAGRLNHLNPPASEGEGSVTEPGNQAAARGGAFALALICAAQFVLQLDFSIVNVALPRIQLDLHMAAAQLQWVVTGYALTFGSLLLAGGRLADLFGRRRMLVAGLALFALASLACGLVPSTITVVLVSTMLTRRLLTRLAIKQVLIAGLAAMAGGQLWLAQIHAGASYGGAVLPGLLLTAIGIGLALPTASIAITSGVQAGDQGLAGALFTAGQQTGAAIGLAVLATVAATRTEHAAGSLVAGYRLSFLVATGFAVLAGVLIAGQLRSRDCQQELARQHQRPGVPAGTAAEAQLRKC